MSPSPAPLAPYALEALPPDQRAALRRHGVTEAPALEAVAGRGASGMITSAHCLPERLPQGLVARFLWPGERREVLLGASGAALGQLPAGTRVSVPGARGAALLAAHHPTLSAVAGSSDGTGGPRVVPLWQDPSLETRGEVLEAESWLPEPGQGIPVLVASDGAPVLQESALAEDPGAAAVVSGERKVSAAFPNAVALVRGAVFSGGGRFQALLLSPDGRQAVRGEAHGPLDRADLVVDDLVALLRARGAERLSAS